MAASSENKRIVNRIFEEIFTKGDLRMIDELVDADCVEHEETPGLEPGREGLKKFVSALREAFPDLRATLIQSVAEGDKVAAYVNLKGTHKGPFLEHAATGQRINVNAFDLLRFSQGKVVEHWGVTDLHALFLQIGATTRGTKKVMAL